MANSDSIDPTKSPPSLHLEDLQSEVEKRKAWFFECQLRRLTLEHFRDVEVNEEHPDALLNVISEALFTVGFPAGQVGSRMKRLTQTYLDSKQPVWTREEREHRNEFAETFIGNTSNWLNYGAPAKLIQNLARLKELYEKNKTSSTIDDEGELSDLGREDPSINKQSPNDRNRLSHAIARVEITDKAPWLIPEVFNGENVDTSDVEKWIKNGETFISNYELELNDVLGGGKIPKETFSLAAPEAYRTWVKEAMKDSLTINSSDAIKVKFLDTTSEPWRFNIKIQTPAYPSLNILNGYPGSEGVKYWIDTSFNPIEEIFINKADSDMGLCLIMRALYLYGTLPAKFAGDKNFQWRDRKPPEQSFYNFFARKAKSITDNPDLQDRIMAVETKLQILLEESAASPCSGAIHFSPLAQEILKQAILGYKFWMDEPFSSFENAGNPGNEKMLSYFNRARRDIDIARKADHREGIDTFSEKEFWSENHYIMFASSEYLAGQLWQSETFLPGKEFLVPQVYVAGGPNGEAVPLTYVDKSAPIPGKDSTVDSEVRRSRMERGKARTLKWLNNRLMFGWAEFNSSGYYREHLMALLNLVDFSLDEEVRKKAEIVTDLLLFDLIRFSHKGSMGAAGGRSQFKSKNTGWDNALGDVVEIILGSRGVFLNREGDIGCSFATTTYKIPDVLLQIGNYPPDSFVDRSRVSVTFDEASKYGIQYSRKSDKKTSIEQGFASKRAKYYGFIKENNDEITQTHFAYGAKEDDTVFWWTLSAYFNKEVAKNTLELIKAFGLRKTGVFDQLFDLIKTIIPLIEKTSHGLIGAALGSITGAGVVTLAGAAIGFFSDDIFDYSVIEEGSDDLSFFLEGSTRTRANIFTYRTRDVMLSSLQNFRAGQFNFQSSVNQATLNTTVNVFTTAAFAGLDLSTLETGLLGGVLGGTVSGAVLGAFAGVAANEIFIEGRETLATHGDGPGWWTGYWALPMVVQHESTAILAYDFNTTQKKLAKAGSHVWFPKPGFRQTEERRTSAYEDDNFFLLDIGDIGPKGYWLFGQIIHKENKIDPDANEEAYIGVFSNQRPKWLTKDSDFYKDKLDGLKSKLINPSADPTLKSLKALENEPDFFAEKDWHVSGKNIWIIQVGSKAEFGSYENFKDRVSRAKIVLDDAGDMECKYSIPGKDGSSRTLSLNYEDGGKFSLDGKQFDTDLYPRFENPFVRGELVEWGQREYVIEHNGKSLLHDFTNMRVPVRLEGEKPPLDGADTVKGLVIYIQTGNEEMEEFTVATATVNIGCEAVAVDEVVAAGPVDEKTNHDPEWIFFDKPARLTPDMTLEIKHPPSSDGEDEPEWNMSFSLKALMGDRRLYDCSVSFPGSHFVDGRRSTGAMPFSIQVSKWQTWQMLDETSFEFFQVSGRPGWDAYYYDYSDLIAIDNNKRLWHRRLEACPGPDSEWKAVANTGPSLLFKESPSICSISTKPGNLFLFAMNNGQLFNCYASDGADVTDKKWERLKPETIPTTILGLPVTNATPVPVPLSPQTQIVAKVSEPGQPGVNLYLSGADDNFYSHAAWLPDGGGAWRQIDTDSTFKPLMGAPFEVSGGHLFALDDHRRLWVGALDDTDVKVTPSWKQLTDDLTNITNFSVAQKGSVFMILISTIRGEIKAAAFSSPDSPVFWERIGEASNFLPILGAKLAWAVPTEGHLDIFTAGADGKIYTTYWEAQAGWEKEHWNIIDPNGHHFEVSATSGMFAVNRVNNQIEVFSNSTDNQIWKTWWT